MKMRRLINTLKVCGDGCNPNNVAENVCDDIIMLIKAPVEEILDDACVT